MFSFLWWLLVLCLKIIGCAILVVLMLPIIIIALYCAVFLIAVILCIIGSILEAIFS